MYVIHAANVRDALPKALRYVLHTGQKEETRNGYAMVCQSPVTIRYEYPKQHVLINRIRDANPFFHLMESMWMLAGREDGTFLDYYVKDFSKLYGVEGIIPDAYGYRWRYGLEYDQLLEIIDQLKTIPNTRRAVLQMWGAGGHDLSDKLSHDLNSTLAKPCNLVATFRIQENKLQMVVFNRSNDLIWGCCGANAVHFPIMQEYIAGMVGIELGRYWQISTNLHLYDTHHKMLLDRLHPETNLWVALKNDFEYEATQPLVTYPASFDNELHEIMEMIDEIHKGGEYYTGNLENRFLRDVVLPMAMSHQYYKVRRIDQALETMETVIAEDWRRAGMEWIQRHSHSIRRVEDDRPTQYP